MPMQIVSYGSQAFGCCLLLGYSTQSYFPKHEVCININRVQTIWACTSDGRRWSQAYLICWLKLVHTILWYYFSPIFAHSIRVIKYVYNNSSSVYQCLSLVLGIACLKSPPSSTPKDVSCPSISLLLLLNFLYYTN